MFGTGEDSQEGKKSPSLVKRRPDSAPDGGRGGRCHGVLHRGEAEQRKVFQENVLHRGSLGDRGLERWEAVGWGGATNESSAGIILSAALKITKCRTGERIFCRRGGRN